MDEERSSNSLIANTRCCFCFPCFGSRPSHPSVGLVFWERVSVTSRSHAPSSLSDDSHWWSRGIKALKKLREWSEIVAGPRWKTFIRRFNRNKSSGGCKHGKYQYDALSYALNFDEGPNGVNGDVEENGYDGYRNFSTRYAAVTPPLKSVDSPTEKKDVAVFS